MATETWYPKAHKLLITTQEYWKPRQEVLISICDHVTDGEDSRSFLQNADNGSSTHFLIRDENGVGVVYQFMPIEWAAWGNGIVSNINPYRPAWLQDKIVHLINPNQFTVSIEHERKWPFYTMPSEAMTAASIELHQWLCDTVPTIVRDRAHIIGHYQIDHIRKANCPGGPGGHLFPFDRIVQAVMNINPSTPIITVPQFQAFYNHEPEALSYWGLPLEPSKQEVLSDGKLYTVQYFERARFELHGNQVMLGLVGAELLASKK
jgi:N-acetyl-anhydromuramyl-L-alanine amidase AmpD